MIYCCHGNFLTFGIAHEASVCFSFLMERNKCFAPVGLFIIPVPGDIGDLLNKDVAAKHVIPQRSTYVEDQPHPALRRLWSFAGCTQMFQMLCRTWLRGLSLLLWWAGTQPRRWRTPCDSLKKQGLLLAHS